MSKHQEKYQDGDQLSAAEAAEVVSENSGHTVGPGYMARLVQDGRVKPQKKIGNAWAYPYNQVKHIVVGGKESAGRHPLPDDQLAPRSLYIREYKRRKAAEKKRQML